MRKLTVKNFSVIKEAELEFGKITVLIGPQSSGKSLLCKLAYFCIEIVPEIANELMGRSPQLDNLKHALQQEFFDWFPPTTWQNQPFEAVYNESSSFDLVIRSSGWAESLDFDFDQQFILRFQRSSESAMHLPASRSRQSSGPLFHDEAVYIPTDRSFFSTPNKGIAALSGKNLGPVIERFAREIDYECRRLRGEMHPISKRMLRFLGDSERVLRGRVVSIDGLLMIQESTSDRRVPFSLLSSGPQDLLPLLNVLSRMTGPSDFGPFPLDEARKHQIALIEEPESSIFPQTQYQLVQLFTALIQSNPVLSLVITTHSPYIMTAFNTLIEAGRVGSMPGNREKVNSFIPEQYWIQESDFKAYAIEDGKLISIFKPESEDPAGEGMINGDYLDGVSDQLGKEFSRLLEIEFAK